MKNSFSLASLISIIMLINTFPNLQAQAGSKPWTQVLFATFSDQEYRSVCGNACYTRNLDQFCQRKSGLGDAFYRWDGEHRCWVRRFR